MKPKWQEDSSCVLLTIFVAALATAAIPQEKKERRNRFGAGQEKRSFEKVVGTIRQEDRPGRGKLPPCMPQSECGAGHTGYRASLDPSPGGSQDTGGAFRS